MTMEFRDTRFDGGFSASARRLGALALRGGAAAFDVVATVGRNWLHRRELRRLYTFSSRELADIGIDRQDLNAAYFGSMHESPGDILTRRARERRRAEQAALAERKHISR